VSEPAILVDGLSKRFRLYHDRNQTLKAAVMRGRRARYEEFWALRDVSLEIAEGATYGFIGTNGSGKSTLLKCLARILVPDEGIVRTRGKVSALLELGAGFHPELSGRENVYLNGSILGLSKAELDRRFDDIVSFAGLERFIDTPVKNYSSGMYVRLGFSVAINVDPDILLVDEVLAVGDEQFQRRCNERFADLRAQGTTIVIVSHSLGSVRAMCDEVAWLHESRLRAVGPAGDLVDQYLAEVHQDRSGEVHHTGSRWGSGEVLLERIEVLDRDGQVTDDVATGDAVTFRLHYDAVEPVEHPTFSMELHTIEGVLLTSPSAREAGLSPDRVEGRGVVDLVVDRLPLLPGTYDLSATVGDDASLHVYDARHRALRFDVEPGTPRESFGGIVTMSGRWHHEVDVPSSSLDGS
jgi:ABC-type polysaccharide/polyol phosphate transport system ATPase subunit